MNTKINALANYFTYKQKLQCDSSSINIDKCLVLDPKLKEFEWETAIFSSKMDDSTLFIDTGNSFQRNIEMYQVVKQTQLMSKKLFADISGTSKRIYANIVEALLVTYITKKIHNSGIAKKDIGIIASYKSQVLLINRLLKRIDNLAVIEVNTVDQYQGRDKSVSSITFKTNKMPFSLARKQLPMYNIFLFYTGYNL